jgi:hypothetical protein
VFDKFLFIKKIPLQATGFFYFHTLQELLMSPRSLFTIIIKVIGILLLKDILLFFSNFFQETSLMLSAQYWISLSSISSLLLTTLVYILLAFTALFKTAWVIDKLRLDQGFREDLLTINIHRSTVIAISITVIGGLFLVEACRVLFFQFINFWNYKIQMTVFSSDQGSGGSIFTFVKLITGVLMIIYARALTNWIELRRRK